MQDQLLRGVEQRLERIEVGGPTGKQISIVIFSKMYRCFHRCWQNQSPCQHIDSLIKHLVVFRAIQLLSSIREDFLNVQIVRDLKIL